MISYSEINENFDEFRKIFTKTSHAPFTNLELVQGKLNFRHRINSVTGLLERVSQTPDNFVAKVILKRDPWADFKIERIQSEENPYFDFDSWNDRCIEENPYFDLSFKIRSDGSIFRDSGLNYKKQVKQKWGILIRRWLKNSVSTFRTHRRTDQIREELVSTVFYKQMEKAQLCTEIYG